MMHDSTSEIPKTIDNVSCRLGDDIASHLVAEASVYVASTGFSLSAFEHLADELERVKAVRFVFTAPAFLPQTAVKEHIRKERRELEARHYRLESLNADLADVEKKISREVQLDRKYALAKEKQRIVKEIRQCRNSKK